MARNLRLLCLDSGLLWDTVASCFGLLGFPGRQPAPASRRPAAICRATAATGLWDPRRHATYGSNEALRGWFGFLWFWSLGVGA